MATVKLNTRSPYFITATGQEGCGGTFTPTIRIDGIDKATVNGTITLTVVANFTPLSYAWTGGSIEGFTTKEVSFTETGAGPVTYNVDVTDNCGVTYTASKQIQWGAAALYEAALDITVRDVVGDGEGQGYTLTGTPALTYRSNTDTYRAIVTGFSGDPYSFSFSATVNTSAGYVATSPLTFSTTSPISGNFASADVSVSTTLTGTITNPVVDDANFSLISSAVSVLEGNTFSIKLITENVPNGFSVPFTISGTVSAADLKRNATKGSFTIKEDNNGRFTDTQTFQVVKDTLIEGDETFILTLDNITPAVSKTITIKDANRQQASEINISTAFENKTLACESTTELSEKVYYALESGESFGNGIVLYTDSTLEEPYPSTGQYYKVLYNSKDYNFKLGEFNQGEITKYNECATGGGGGGVVKDPKPVWQCSAANITIYQGVVGQPLNYHVNEAIIVKSIEPANYVLGTNDYDFTIQIPEGFANEGTDKICTFSGVGIATAPTWTCTDTALNVIDGITGEPISYDYNRKIKSTDFISILNEDGEAVYKTGSNLTYTFKHKIPEGYANAGTEFSPACTDTASASASAIVFTCDIAQLEIPDGIVGNSVAARASTQKGTITSISPSAYVLGSNIYTATIEIPSGYSNSGNITCDFTANAEERVIPPSNSITVSSERVSEIGGQGNIVCDLNADKVVYYTGKLTEGTSLYTNKELTAPFGGTDKWHKLELVSNNNELVDYYAKIYSYPPGWIQRLNICGCDDGECETETEDTTEVIVKISAKTDDGDQQHAAFTSQKVTLTATIIGLDGSDGKINYQWFKGTASQGGTNNLTAISGETKNTLVINDGGQTQTTTGSIYYNCLINSTHEDDQNYLIVWDTRPSFSLRYYASAEANIQACTGTPVTLYGDRDGVTAFCVAKKFYSNAAGTTGGISAGTYSDSTTGTDGNFRYIEASGIPQGCVPGDGNGCNPIVTQPTTGNIQKVKTRRCSNGRIEYFLFDGFSYGLDYILDIKDVSQQGGRGCYQIIEIFDDIYTLPDGYYTLELTDLQRAQPYSNCDECVDPVQEESEEQQQQEEQIANTFYARFKTCGENGGRIIGVSSTDEISTSLTIKIGNECLGYLDNLAAVTGIVDLSSYPDQFFSCKECLASITGTTQQIEAVETLGYFRQYIDCETGGDITKDYGSTTDLGDDWPAVVIDAGVCMKDNNTSGTTSEVNILTLTSYTNCLECDEIVNPVAPPAPAADITINKMQISSSYAGTSSDACNLINVFDKKVAYTGTLQDGTYLYTDESLTNLYTATNTDFVKSRNGHVFKIGATNPGQVSKINYCDIE